MAYRSAAGLMAVVLMAAPARGAETEERLAEVRLWIDQGSYDEAIPAARQLARLSRDEATRVEATRLLATALRRKSNYKTAAAACKDLAALVEEGSDEHIRAAATAEVLLASPDGRYSPLESRATGDEGAGPEGPAGRTLADDGYLADALAALGEGRAAALGPKVAALKRLRAPPEVAASLAEIADGFRRARVLAPEMDPKAERDAGEAAGQRLDDLAKQLRPKLRSKLDAVERTVVSRGTVSSALRKELEQYRDMCEKMAEAEESFRGSLKQIGGQGWSRRGPLNGASIMRGFEYGGMARRFRFVLLHGNRAGLGPGRRRRP